MYIGEAARRSGASEKAIRHYERLGLLPHVRRSGAYRIFDERDISLIQLIKQAQTLGFKLAELKTALNSSQEEPSWQQIATMIEAKVEAIALQITELQTQQQNLRDYHQQIVHCLGDDPDCSEPLY